MTKEIPLSQGMVALVDDDMYEELMQYKWSAIRRRYTWYAFRSTQRVDGRQTTILMHRAILQTPKGMLTDHADGNGLNNIRSNLRACTKQQNQQNQRGHGGSSKYKGVSWSKARKKWHARIETNGKTSHLGYFANEDDAAKSYDVAALRLFGEFALLNFR